MALLEKRGSAVVVVNVRGTIVGVRAHSQCVERRASGSKKKGGRSNVGSAPYSTTTPSACNNPLDCPLLLETNDARISQTFLSAGKGCK